MSNSMSGVTIDAVCFEKFESMKLKHDLRYIIFKIDKKGTIIVESEGEKTKTYDDFVAALPKNLPRYGVADVSYETKHGVPNSKLVFFFWSPEDSPVREKMLYASSKNSIRKAMLGIQMEVQANDMDDVKKEGIQGKLANV